MTKNQFFINISVIITMLLTASSIANLKTEQQRYERVKVAYSEKKHIIEEELENSKLKLQDIQVLLRVYKNEKIIELWCKSKIQLKYTYIKDYKVCQSSGTLGPKRKGGDGQTPEGFYFIERFNPLSNYYLSLGINYPNFSDRILGCKSNLGGDIFIHGNCVTIGCLPITDDKIKELYIYCLESQNNGHKVDVLIFPCRLSDSKYKELQNSNKYSQDSKNLWGELKKEYDYFEKNKQLSKVEFLKSGRHSINNSK